MKIRCRCIALFALNLSFTSAYAQPVTHEQAEQSNNQNVTLPKSVLATPNQSLVDAIRALPTNPNTPNLSEMKSIEVPSTNMSPTASVEEATKVPFVAPNSMILRFKSSATPRQVAAYLKRNSMKVLQTFPTSGAVQVSADLKRFFIPKPTDVSPNHTLVRGSLDAISAYKIDPLILSATPDMAMTVQSLSPEARAREVSVPKGVPVPTHVAAAWGAGDIQANDLWKLDGSNDGAVVGVIDLGFSRHNALAYVGYDSSIQPNDHGNHVAGIACAKPEASEMRGVVPNCFVRPHAPKYVDIAPDASDAFKYMNLFSQIMGSMEQFVNSSNDAKVFNVSLAYNWASNFENDPSSILSKDWRRLVEMQASYFTPFYEAAKLRDITIFSAAGNDSDGLAKPVPAQYASPMNFAALASWNNGIHSAIIVEAHDKNGKRAKFSNTGGMMSCPGVEILSTVAFDESNKPVRNAYGIMDGTSQAAPFCAAGFALFRLVRPKLTSTAALDCVLNSTEKSSSGTPMMKLSQAIKNCP
ncbi:S8 family peptidase [Methylocystis sp. JAN1]|uniref:S8 family peptidase n=1 Tax=Methylocystis sp. JAN1 TaxID=3397211 RepID=UPI003FA236AC